jgi:Uncharacterized protein conserved in bacteria (DUF2188)
MLGRHVYRVSVEGDVWHVTKDGEAPPARTFPSREAALRAAYGLAAADKPSRVTVERADGTLEEKTFGADPGQTPGQ